MPLDLHPRFEAFGAEAATGGGEALGEMRRTASGVEDAAHLPALIDAAAIKRENILQRDRVSFHPDDLGNGNHLTRTVGETRDLDNGVDGVRDLLANGTLGNVQVGHGNHVFDARQGITRRVRVDGGERTLVAGVHGLEHVEGFFTAHLAHYDAIRTHAQAVDDELAHADRAFAFDVGRTGLGADDVFLLELQFGRIFDGDDTLRIRNVTGKNVENGGFARAGSSGDEQVQAAFDHGREHFEHGLGQGLVVEHVARGDGIAAKAADGKAGAVEGQGRNDGVDARAILQAGIHHGRRLIDATPDAGDDAVDDLHQVLVVLEGQAGNFQFAGAFDVDTVEAVDQNVGNGGIFEQRLERAEAEDFVKDLARQLFALGEEIGRAHD